MTEPAPQPERPVQPGRARIFLNYRRDDTAAQVARLEDALGRELEPGQVFRDRSGITGGERWKERLRDEVAASSVFLCIIGNDWLNARDPESKMRRIDEEDDWVRVEIEEALRRVSDGLLFLPVLVDGAALPRPDHLPKSLRGLCEHEKVTLRTDDWDTDVPKILKCLLDAGAQPLRQPSTRTAPKRVEEEGELSKLYRDLAEAKANGRDDAVQGLESRIRAIKKAEFRGPHLEPGMVFGKRFELRERLGQGGFGEVWRAYDSQFRGMAAVKFLYPHLARNPEYRSRFDRGARTMQRLNHPRIVRVLNPATNEDGWFWYAMEYVPGGSLREAVTNPSFPREQGIKVVEDVAGALDHAYEAEGLIHRDVKPANILIDAQGRGKLTDFDLVKDPTSTQLTRAVGDFDFGPPEILGEGDAYRQSDVYSLAMTLIFCLSKGKVVGREGETIDSLTRFIGYSAQRDVLKTALSPDPAKRPASCLSLLEEWKRQPRVQIPAWVRATTKPLAILGLLLVLLVVFADELRRLVDRRSPVIEIDGVQDEAWVQVPGTLTGSIEDLTKTTLEVNGRDVPIDSEGQWSFELSESDISEEGIIVVSLVAVDEGERERALSLRLRADREAPQLEVKAAGKATSATQATLTIAARDDGELRDITLQGRRVEPGDHVLDLTEEGDNIVRVEAIDASGRVSSDDVTIRRDTMAPELFVSAPASGAKVEWEIRFSGTVLDQNPSHVLIDDKVTAYVDEQGHWSANVVCLESGPRTFRVVAIDKVGRESAAEVIEVEVDASDAPAFRVPSWAEALPDAGVTESGWASEVRERETGIEMVLIPAGSYLRGAPESDDMAYSDERPQHRVTITQPFYLGKFEVTNAQFRLLQSDHNSGDYEGLSLDGEDKPAVYVSWHEANAFCDQFGFRLPTEAQWEYACRAGTTTRFPWGDDPDEGAGWANCADETVKSKYAGWTTFSWPDVHIVTSPVGTFRANAFGLYDMIGNVQEWCSDGWNSSEYERHADGVSDPEGPDEGNGWLLRGGSWYYGPRHCRSSVRYFRDPTFEGNDVGFRVSRAP